MVKIWEDLLTDVDKKVIEEGRYGKERGLGRKPLLLIIDVQHNYTGDNLPIQKQLKKWPSGVGASAWAAIGKIQEVRTAAKEAGTPIIQSRNVQKKAMLFDSFSAKTSRDQSKYLDGREETEIVDALRPTKDELVIDKAYASVFYGTPLQSYLVKLRIDTLIIVGGSTSGCVRATVVDAVTRNYNVAVVEDCVYDRISVSHKISLLDMWMKYADVLDSQNILEYLVNLGKE